MLKNAAYHKSTYIFGFFYLLSTVILFCRTSNKSLQLGTDFNEAITGLSFHDVGKTNYLFVTTTSCVMSFNLQEKAPKKVVKFLCCVSATAHNGAIVQFFSS